MHTTLRCRLISYIVTMNRHLHNNSWFLSCIGLTDGLPWQLLLRHSRPYCWKVLHCKLRDSLELECPQIGYRWANPTLLAGAVKDKLTSDDSKTHFQCSNYTTALIKISQPSSPLPALLSP